MLNAGLHVVSHDVDDEGHGCNPMATGRDVAGAGATGIGDSDLWNRHG